MIDVTHDGDHRRPRHFNLADILILHEVFEGLVGHLIFEGDDLRVGPELGRHILDQFSIERLVDGDKHAAHEQRSDQVFAAYSQFFRQVFYADAFCHRDGTGDGDRLLGNLRSAKTRRRRKALHWAFLGLGVLLASTPLLRSCPLRTRSFPWRRSETACATYARARRTESGARTKTRPSGAK